MAKETHPEDADLWALAAGEQPADPSASAHVDGCSSCRARVQQRAAMRALVQQARPVTLSPGQRAGALVQVEDAWARERERQAYWWARRGWLAPVLGVAMSAGAALALWLDQGRAPNAWRGGMEPPARPAPEVTVAPAVPPVNPALVAVLPGEPELLAAPQARQLPVASPQGQRPNASPARGVARRGDGVASTAVPSTQVAAAPAPALLAPAAVVAPVPEPAFSVDAWSAHARKYPSLAHAIDAWRDGRPLDATRAALDRVTAADGEGAVALELAREVALGHPLEGVVSAVAAAGAAQADAGVAEALDYLACEAGIIGRRAREAVDLCRAFAARHPSSPRARDASYVAGTLSRDSLQDCAGAVEDYSRALVFSGQLGTLTDDALFWRAWCREELGQAELARADLSVFLGRYPSRRVDPQVIKLHQRLSR